MSDAYALDEPPAKRARYDEPSNGAIDVPSSPVDDMDDDFYESTPVNAEQLPVNDTHPPLSTNAAAPASATATSLALPGLGLPSSASPQPDSKHVQSGAEELEDGELSDSESLYNDSKPADSAPVDQQHAVPAIPGPSSSEQNASVNGAAAPSMGADDSALEAILASAVSSDELETKTKPADTESKEQVVAGKDEFLLAGEANRGDANAEWQLDSEASDSSSDSSSDDSSDSDGGESEEGELLDPEEQVRLLMMESAEDNAGGDKVKVKTLNEVVEEYKKPEIDVTETTKITELGKVESIVDNLVLIKANVSGDYRVLETGSALCLGNRTVIGQVSETIGRIQEPRYSMGFSDPAEIEALGMAKGTPVYYVDEHSTFVFTEPLKAQKFTDASNLHDEEANDVEFSDDEKEAEFKRKQKELKKAKAEANRDPQDRPQHVSKSDIPAAPAPNQYQGGGLNYSDDDEDLGMYKPLARPAQFEMIVGAGAPLEDRSHVRRGGGMRGGRGGWPDRGRGFRGRGGGGGGAQGGMQGGGGGGGRGNQRGDRFAGPAERGGRRQQEHARAQERGRHQDHGKHPDPRNRNAQRENRSASSASPNRQNLGRQQPQHSPPRSKKARKRERERERQERARFNNSNSSPAPAAAQPASANANAYAQNNNINTSAWSMPQQNAGMSASTPAVPAGAYVNPAFYGQAGQGAPAPAPAPAQDQQQQQNLAQWAQWFQLAAAMQGQQQQQQQQSQPPVPQQPQAAPQPQQPYQYQYGYNNAPNPGAPQTNTQGATPSLQDLLRSLSGGQQNR